MGHLIGCGMVNVSLSEWSDPVSPRDQDLVDAVKSRASEVYSFSEHLLDIRMPIVI